MHECLSLFVVKYSSFPVFGENENKERTFFDAIIVKEFMDRRND